MSKIESPPAVEENPQKKERPFNPNSQELIKIEGEDGTQRTITIEAWLLELGTNGRGGT